MVIPWFWGPIIGDSKAREVLPAVAYLEMARAAVAQATPAPTDTTILELHNIVWAQPIVITEHKEVTIALFANDSGQIDYEIYIKRPTCIQAAT